MPCASPGAARLAIKSSTARRFRGRPPLRCCTATPRSERGRLILDTGPTARVLRLCRCTSGGGMIVNDPLQVPGQPESQPPQLVGAGRRLAFVADSRLYEIGRPTTLHTQENCGERPDPTACRGPQSTTAPPRGRIAGAHQLAPAARPGTAPPAFFAQEGVVGNFPAWSSRRGTTRAAPKPARGFSSRAKRSRQGRACC